MPYLAGFPTPQDYGALGNGTHDDTSAILEALNSAPAGGTVYLPPGTYGTSSPITVPPQVSLWGSHSSRIDSTTCSIKPLSTFIGAAVILMVDQATGGYSLISTQQGLFFLTLDGSNLSGSTIDGIQAQGYVHGAVIQDVQIRNVPNHGIAYVSNASGNAYSWRGTRILANTPGGYGFAVGGMTDSTWIDVQSIQAGKSGFLFAAAPSNCKFIGCRSEYSNWNGFEFSGAWTGGNAGGGCTLVDCSTDGNNRNGILVTATGDSPLSIIGGYYRRDGANGTAGGAAYAGIQCTGSTIPVEITQPTIIPGVALAGGVNSPQYGVAVTSSSTDVVVSSGVAHAATTAWFDDGSNSNVLRGANLIERVGTETSYTTNFHGMQSTLSVPPTWDSGPSTTKYGLVANMPLPEDQNAIAWTVDPMIGSQTATATSGTIYLQRVYIRQPATTEHVTINVAAAGTSLTAGENLLGLYNSAGTRVAITADQSTVWAASGEYTVAWTASAVLTPGYYYVALLSVGTGTQPTFYGTASTGASLLNIGTTSSTWRAASLTGQTGLAATLTLTSFSASGRTWTAVLT